jgi:hypothetical protein
MDKRKMSFIFYIVAHHYSPARAIKLTAQIFRKIKNVKAELTWSAFQNKQNNQSLSFVQKLFKSLAEQFPQSTDDFSLKFLEASS